MGGPDIEARCFSFLSTFVWNIYAQRGWKIMSPKLVIIGLIFFIVMAILLAIDSFLGEKSIADLRREQTENNKKENDVKKQFDNYVNKKTKFNKKYEIETLCLNAGYRNLKYPDIVLINLICAGVMFFVFGIILKNIFLGLLIAFIASKVPIQALTVIKNKRLDTLERQVGVFMNMVTQRYINTSDFEKSLILTTEEFAGIEPMHTELKYTVAEVSVGVDMGQALDNLARRCGNQYLKRFSDFYKIAYKLGTAEVREKLLTQAYEQFRENQEMKDFMKKEIAEPVRDAYIMLITVPVFFVVCCFIMPGYFDFMFKENLGKFVVAAIVALMLGCVWFINKKVAAPLDKPVKQ